jgi:large subunit ribosomal protein L19
VIARRGEGVREMFTVRRIVQGEGVERIFPLHSPRVADIVVKKKGQVRRAKLHYLRERVGRGTRVEEKLGGVVEKQAPAPKAPVEKPAEPKAPEAKAPEAKAPAK